MMTCINYLGATDIRKPPGPMRGSFVEYSALFFHSHADLGDLESDKVTESGFIDRLIRDDLALLEKVSRFQIYDYGDINHHFVTKGHEYLDRKGVNWHQDHLLCTGFLQFFARRGAANIVVALLDLGLDVNEWDKNLNTHYALWRQLGREAM